MAFPILVFTPSLGMVPVNDCDSWSQGCETVQHSLPVISQRSKEMLVKCAMLLRHVGLINLIRAEDDFQETL